MKNKIYLLLTVLLCMLACSCKDHKIIYYAYNSYGEPTEVYSAPSRHSTVVAELPSPSNEVELFDERFDKKSEFTHIKTFEGIEGYALTKHIRNDYQYGSMRTNWNTHEHRWFRETYAYEEAARAGSYTVANILYYMKSISFHRYNFDEGKWTFILIGLGVLSLLIHCFGWFDAELGETGYWILNMVYWLCYLGILFSEFVLFCMHSPFDISSPEPFFESSFIVELIVGLVLFAFMLYAIILSVCDMTNMLGSLIPQGAFGLSGYDVIDFNKFITVIFLIMSIYYFHPY